MQRMRLALAAATLAGLLSPAAAQAFCGFYVSGAEGSLYNEATKVVLMREGTRTALSMQNDYRGPPEDFAMVVPVPVVLSEENVRTLPREVFDRVDRLAAPRLVEYWEQDPCVRPRGVGVLGSLSGANVGFAGLGMRAATQNRHGVRVEARFDVAEYDIVILSAEDSSGLERWLREERYNIPRGARRVLRPYVESGTKFFVAKVDVERVRFENGRAVLSPLRVHYDSDELALPIRLGLLNSRGKQDLIVHILARGRRYEAANYGNVTIPTNIRVYDRVRHRFGEFYASLFDRTLERHPRTVVTEYAWDAGTCDPCPVPALGWQELATLGADVMPPGVGSFVLTRLHYRYDHRDLGEDLVFRAAPPLQGGRGTPDRYGRMQDPTTHGPVNNFQARHAILHRWAGPIECDDPQRGRWGGPPNGLGARQPLPAVDTAQIRRRSLPLPRMVKDPIPALDVVPEWIQRRRERQRPRGDASPPPAPTPIDGVPVLAGFAALGLVLRRRRR